MSDTQALSHFLGQQKRTKVLSDIFLLKAPKIISARISYRGKMDKRWVKLSYWSEI